MKKRLTSSILSAFLAFSAFPAFALEGMWLPSQSDKYIDKMEAQGCKLTAADIYDINNASLKDAIVQFAGYCTAELVSSQGLLFTNHHCGYESIAELSTAGSGNYLDNGYWAQSFEQEIQVPGLTVSRLVSVTDVTKRVLESANLAAEIQLIKKEYEASTGMKVDVKPMFYGNEYYVMVYEVFKDIRMVGAPPSSIGNYGGDTDNWFWPRHTGDFSVFRVYAGADNKPAEYSPENKPYTPKKFLKINIGGIKEGDFAMIMGYPGSTTRYLTESNVNKITQDDYPDKVKIITSILEIMKESMDADENVRIQLASNYASLANSAKYFKGVIEGIGKSACNDAKESQQTAFATWVNQDEARKAKYGSVIANIDAIMANTKQLQKLQNYLGYGYFSVDFIATADGFVQLYDSLKVKGSDYNPVVTELKTAVNEFFAERDMRSEEGILASVMRLGNQELPTEYSLKTFGRKAFTKSKPAAGDDKFDAFADLVFSTSIFTSAERMNAFLNKPSAKVLENDPGFQFVQDVYALLNIYRADAAQKQSGLKDYYTLYLEGLREFKKQEYLYPDANFTLRLTYGNIKAYSPRDGINYNWYTTTTGILEKYKPGDQEFNIDSKLYDLLSKKDFGRYGKEELPVCFVADLDITGGNSGSPVMDANGNWIGIAFDGVWEGMVGDLYFDPSKNRTISVDARYVLFIIEKHGNCKRIIDEMEIIQ